MKGVEQQFGDPPQVKSEEQTKFILEMSQAKDARNLAIETAGRQQNNSIYWAFVGAAAGFVVGAKFGKIPGAIIGAVLGAGIVIGKEGNAYQISKQQADKLLELTKDYIRQKYPDAARREDFLNRKKSAQIKCWLDFKRELFPRPNKKRSFP